MKLYGLKSKIMKKDNYLFKPTFKSIGFYFFGFVFFGLLGYKMTLNNWNSNNHEELYITILFWIISIIFISVSITMLFTLLNLRYLKLNDQELIITKPLLFHSKHTLVSDINFISQKKYDIKSSNNNLYNGLQTILQLKNGYEIKFNSFETSDYNNINDKLRKLIKNRERRNSEIYKRKNKNKWDGYGWLAILIVVTVLLSYSFIIENK